MRRETADAEARSTQLEAELARMVVAQKEREADLDAKEAALDRHASGSDYLNSPAWQQGCMAWYGCAWLCKALHVQLAHESCVEERQADLNAKIPPSTGASLASSSHGMIINSQASGGVLLPVANLALATLGPSGHLKLGCSAAADLLSQAISCWRGACCDIACTLSSIYGCWE